MPYVDTPGIIMYMWLVIVLQPLHGTGVANQIKTEHSTLRIEKKL